VFGVLLWFGVVWGGVVFDGIWVAQSLG